MKDVSEAGELFKRNEDQEIKDRGVLIFLGIFLYISNFDYWIHSMSS